MPDFISFAEFGPLFAKEIFTRELIEARVRAAVPRRLQFDAGRDGYGEARALSVRADGPRAERCLVACRVHVALDLDLVFLRFNPLALRVRFPLDITFRPYPGLLIAAEVRPLEGRDVELESRDDRGLAQVITDFLKDALLASLPAAVSKWLTDLDALKGGLAGSINETLKASEDGRVIDLGAMLHEGLTLSQVPPGPRPVPGLPVALGPGAAMPRDEKIFLQMEDGSKRRGDVLLQRGEGVRLRVYGQIPYAPGLMFSHGGNLDFGIGGDVSGSLSVREDAWGEDKAVSMFPPAEAKEPYFRAPATGRYPFTIACSNAASPLRVWVAQERTGLVQGTLGGLKPVCFDRFGEELMRHGLSAEVIGGMVRQQMGGGKFSAMFEVAASPWGPLDVSVELALKSVAAVPTTAPPMSEGRVFTLAAKVQAMYAPAEKGGGEAKRNHRLFRLAGIGLVVVVHMRTAKHPASVVPVPADLEHWRLDIDWSKLEVINEEWEAAVKEWLQGKTKGNVDEWLRRQWRSAAGFLESQLPLLGGLLAQTISKISEDAAQKTPGPVDTPPPVGGEHLFSNEIKGVPVLAPGRAGYHEVQLKRGQKIKVEAEVRPEGDVEYVPAYASVQVLDGFKGVLTQMPRLEFPKGKRTPRRVRIVFKVPADGTYYLGIKLWPRVDDTALAGVRFRITAAPA